MLELSIIIVSYNTKDFLKECLQSIVDSISSQLQYEVIVVDNASTDGSVEEISNFKFKISNLKIITNKENLGFSRANNVGLKAATGKYILFLNSDTIVYKHTLEELITFMSFHTKAGAATCYVALANGILDDASHRGFPTPWNSFCYFSGLAKIFSKSLLFNGYNLGWKDLDKVHEIDALAGACMIVRREAGKEVDWWDEDYFFYGEDIDFCYKLKEKGWKIYFVPTVKILHYKGVSSGIKEISKDITKANKELQQKITKARFDAMRLFYKKHYLHKYPRIVTSIVLKGIAMKQSITESKFK